MAKVLVTGPFVNARNAVQSTRLRDRIDSMICSVSQMPLMGALEGNRRAIRAFGPKVRRAVVKPYVIIYRYDEPSDTVFVLDLIYGPHIR
ncbi:MAG: type II toxin-antitoxin system RelE/ParE family toxin [Atopobiaceae bacterium]|nr:type II toxin-antitoxin system RelE/ParE family toxin [Atopobiaceae bacterium]